MSNEPQFDYHGRCVAHGRLDCPPCEAAEAATEPQFISVEDRVAQSIREWIESVTPCHCAPDYYERGLIAPDCQMHDLVLDADTAARDLRAEGLLADG